jgi:hypothetical protein
VKDFFAPWSVGAIIGIFFGVGYIFIARGLRILIFDIRWFYNFLIRFSHPRINPQDYDNINYFAYFQTNTFLCWWS